MEVIRVTLWYRTCKHTSHLECGSTHCGATLWGEMKKLIFLLLIATATVAFADNSKLAPELRGKQSTQQVRVIVQYAPGTQINCNSLLGLVDCLVNDIVKLGGTILAPLPIVNGLVASLTGPALQTLSNSANVVYISTDRPLTPTLSNAAPAVPHPAE